MQQEHSELSELMGDFGLENAKGKGVAADHAIEQQFAQSEHDLNQANERVTAVNDAIGELQNLESFIRTTKPPRDEAVTLTEEIVRQLLEKLNFLRLDFIAPNQQAPVSGYQSAAIVHRFREQQGNPSGPATPQKPLQAPPRPAYVTPIEEEREEQEHPESSTAASGTNPFEDKEEAPGPSSAAFASSGPLQLHDSPIIMEEEPQRVVPEPQQSHFDQEPFTPVTTPRPGPQITTPAAVAPPFTARSPSMNSAASPRVLSRFDSRSSTESTSNNNMAVAQSKEQSRQLLEKASQKLASLLVNANDKNFDANRKPGDPAVRRAPQVLNYAQL